MSRTVIESSGLVTLRTNCRSCNAAGLQTILELGDTPLANRLLQEDQLDEAEPKFPLTLQFCPRCSLVQLRETIDPKLLFSEYLYFSSFSDTMLRHAEALVAELVESRQLDASSLAVEVASNDGYLLQYFQGRGIPVLGIDPAANIAAVANKRGIQTLSRFFGPEVAAELRRAGQAADVLIGINVLGHVADLNGFVAGLSLLLKPDGIVVIEVPYVRQMIERNEFDTIYHEHLHYFSVTSLDQLFRQHGLSIVEAEQIDIHGGSLRIRAMHAKAAIQRLSVDRMLKEEASAGVTAAAFYEAFASRAAGVMESLRELIGSLKQEGNNIAAYGAAAKGITLLSCSGIGQGTLDFVVDRSPYKQNHFLPGLHLPILPPSELLVRHPDYVLLLTWNFAGEIIAQQREYLTQGGRFILPIPRPRVITE